MENFENKIFVELCIILLYNILETSRYIHINYMSTFLKGVILCKLARTENFMLSGTAGTI